MENANRKIITILLSLNLVFSALVVSGVAYLIVKQKQQPTMLPMIPGGGSGPVQIPNGDHLNPMPGMPEGGTGQ